MKLTENNYYSIEASRNYMTCSQYGEFIKCPEAAYRRFLLGDIHKEEHKAFLDGQFMHTLFESEQAHKAFIDTHPELLSSRGATKGNPKSEYLQAYKDFEAAKKDETFMRYMTGRKEVIFTGELCGLPWSIKADVVNDEELICTDLKYIADLDATYWKRFAFDLHGNAIPKTQKDSFAYHKNVEVSWIEKWDYWTRIAVYRNILYKSTGSVFKMYIAAISKQFPANRRIYNMNNSTRLQMELQDLEQNIALIKEQRNGNDLTRCEKCTYCRSTLKTSKVVDAESVF